MASTTMAALATQTRFVRQQRRMALPLTELDAECFHAALQSWRAYGSDDCSDALTRAEGRLRSGYDEGESRLALLARLVAGFLLFLGHPTPGFHYMIIAFWSGKSPSTIT